MSTLQQFHLSTPPPLLSSSKHLVPNAPRFSFSMNFYKDSSNNEPLLPSMHPNFFDTLKNQNQKDSIHNHIDHNDEDKDTSSNHHLPLLPPISLFPSESILSAKSYPISSLPSPSPTPSYPSPSQRKKRLRSSSSSSSSSSSTSSPSPIRPHKKLSRTPYTPQLDHLNIQKDSHHMYMKSPLFSQSLYAYSQNT